MSDHDARPGKTPDELREIYAEMAPRFERFEPVDRLLTGRARRRLFARAVGRVLDVACGTGINARYLPRDVELVGIDLSPAMLSRARARSDRLGIDADFRQGDASVLPFDDGACDTVVSTMSTCTFPDPVAALREMARVCAPDGQVLLLEHGRSSVGPIARFQDWRAPSHFAKTGCRWNHEPVELVTEAGIEVETVDRRLLGVFTAMVLSPT